MTSSRILFFQVETNDFSCNMTAMSTTYKDSGLSSSLFPCSWFKRVLKPFETVLVASQLFLAGLTCQPRSTLLEMFLVLIPVPLQINRGRIMSPSAQMHSKTETYP
jgi:hypothetical protein